MSRRSSDLAALYVAAALVSAGYGVMFSALDDFRDGYRISESALGVVVSVGFFTSFLGQIALAPLADRGHARLMLCAGFAVTTAGTLAMAFSTSAPAMFAARFAMGLGAGMTVPAVRRTIILADPDNMGANLGRAVSFDVIGFAAGPLIAAATIGPFGLRAPFLITAALMALVLVVLARVPVEETTAAPSSQTFAFGLLRIRPVLGAILIGLALFVLIGTFDSLWSITMDDMGAPPWIANVGIVVFVVPMVILGPLGGRLAERKGPFRWSALGLLVGSACTLCYAVLPEPWMMVSVGVLHGLNDGLTVTGTGVAIAMVVPAGRAASAQGLLGGLQTLTGGVVALVASAAYEHVGRTVTFASATAAMVILVALGYACAGPARTMRRDPTTPPATDAPVTVDATVA